MKKDVTINIRGTRHFGLHDAVNEQAPSGALIHSPEPEYRIETVKLPEAAELDDPALMEECCAPELEPDEEEIARILQETLDSLTERASDGSTTELCTEGVLTVHRDGIELSYDESDITGMDGARTSIFVGRNGVTTFSRTGEVNTHMVFEKNKRYFCICPEAAEVPVCIATSDMDSSLTADGGEIHIDFCVEIGGNKAEHNEYFINVC